MTAYTMLLQQRSGVPPHLPASFSCPLSLFSDGQLPEWRGASPGQQGTEAKTWGSSVHCSCQMRMNGKRERDICLLASCRKYFNVHSHTQRKDPPKKACVCVCVCVCVCRKVIFTKDRERGKLTQTKREKKRRVGDRAERERQESRRILLWIDTKWKDFC